jgi:fucose permease
MSFKKIHSIYLVSGLFNVTNSMLFTTYFLYLTNVLNLSYTQATLLDLPLFITQFFVELPSGFFADKYGYKKAVVIGTLALTIAPLIFFLTTSYPILLFAGVFYGIGFAFISGAFDALAYETFDSDLKSFLTIRNLIQNIVNIIVPIITIWSTQILNLRTFYLIDFLFHLVIIVILIFGVKEIKKVQEYSGYSFDFIKVGWASVSMQLHSSKALVYQANSQFLWGISKTAIDLFWIKLIEISAGQDNIGFVFALASIVGIIGNIMAYKLKIIKTAFWLSFLIHSIFIIFAGVFIGSTFAIICVLGQSFFINLHEVLSQLIINKIVQVDRASMFSFFSFLSGIGKIISILSVGFIADTYGVGSVWILAGLIIIIISWQLYMVQKHIEKRI